MRLRFVRTVGRCALACLAAQPMPRRSCRRATASAEQPPVPGGSASRTQALKTTYEAKYRKVYKLLKNDKKLRSKIREAAGAYGIDPMHIVGAIVGEHTYNVDAYDRLQTYYVKAVSYLDSAISFSYDGEDIDDFIQRPEFAACNDAKGSYDLWTCRESRVGQGFPRQETDFPNDRFSATFFQPFYAGQTFGLGQLNPLTALEMSDLVHRVSGLPTLDSSDPRGVYKTIMDPDLTLPYVAATLKKSIDAYKSIAGFDISQNPGLTATLYNLGNPEARARALKAENDGRKKQGLDAEAAGRELLRLAGQREAAGAAGAVLEPGACRSAFGRSVQHRQSAPRSLPHRAMAMRAASRLASAVAWPTARRVDDDTRIGCLGKPLQFLGIVPDHVEIADDLLDHRPARHAAPAMLQRRQIGGADAERRGHLLLRDALRAAQFAQPFAERRHGWRGSLRRRSLM